MISWVLVIYLIPCKVLIPPSVNDPLSFSLALMFPHQRSLSFAVCSLLLVMKLLFLRSFLIHPNKVVFFGGGGLCFCFHLKLNISQPSAPGL